MYLRIQNNGEMDFNAVFLLGASTKEGDDTKIGFFGSGNKYAIACLLRNNIKFKVFAGEQEVKIASKEIAMGDSSFQQIFMNRKPTSFTTRMGPKWEVWMALREFVCNAIDEGGYDIGMVANAGIEGEAGVTRFFVEMVGDVSDFYHDIDKYITTKDANTNWVNTEADSIFTAYRKGVRIIPISEKKRSLFNYNFSDIKINESRVYNSEWELKCSISTLVGRMVDHDMIRTYVRNSANDTYVEGNLEAMSWTYLNSEWPKALEGIEIVNKDDLKFRPQDNAGEYFVVHGQLFNCLKVHFKGQINFFGSLDNRYEEVEPSEILKGMVFKANEEMYGIFGVALAIKFVKYWDENTVAHYNRVEKVVYISVEHDEEYMEVCSTLFEEYSHNEGWSDCTRAWEQHMMKEIIRLKRIEAKYEAIRKAIE